MTPHSSPLMSHLSLLSRPSYPTRVITTTASRKRARGSSRGGGSDIRSTPVVSRRLSDGGVGSRMLVVISPHRTCESSQSRCRCHLRLQEIDVLAVHAIVLVVTKLLRISPWSGSTPATRVHSVWKGMIRTVPVDKKRRRVTVDDVAARIRRQIAELDTQGEAFWHLSCLVRSYYYSKIQLMASSLLEGVFYVADPA